MIYDDLMLFWEHHGEATWIAIIWFGSVGKMLNLRACSRNSHWETVPNLRDAYSYGHLLVITSYFYGIIHSINVVFLVLITGISGLKCTSLFPTDQEITRWGPSFRHRDRLTHIAWRILWFMGVQRYLVANYPRIVSGLYPSDNISRVHPLLTGVINISHLLSGMSHRVVFVGVYKPTDSEGTSPCRNILPYREYEILPAGNPGLLLDL